MLRCKEERTPQDGVFFHLSNIREVLPSSVKIRYVSQYSDSKKMLPSIQIRNVFQHLDTLRFPVVRYITLLSIQIAYAFQQLDTIHFSAFGYVMLPRTQIRHASQNLDTLCFPVFRYVTHLSMDTLRFPVFRCVTLLSIDT